MSISKGGQSVKPYVGGKEVKEAYVGSALVYQNVPNYEYPPYVMNKGYTTLEVGGSNSATLVAGVGIVLTLASTGTSNLRFKTPEKITTKKKGVIVVNGTTYSFNYPRANYPGYDYVGVSMTKTAPYTLKAGYYSNGYTTTDITQIDDPTNVVVSLLTIEDA